MYFLIIEAIPEPNSDAAKEYGGSHVACWINTADLDDAKGRATTLVSSFGWIVQKVIEEKEVSEEDYSADDAALEYFEQAFTDNEVCVFYTFPKN